MCGMARPAGALHVAKITRRHGEREYNSYLVRRSIREGRRVRHETVANVSGLPPEAIEALTFALQGVRLLVHHPHRTSHPSQPRQQLMRARHHPTGDHLARGLIEDRDRALVLCAPPRYSVD